VVTPLTPPPSVLLPPVVSDDELHEEGRVKDASSLPFSVTESGFPNES